MNQREEFIRDAVAAVIEQCDAYELIVARYQAMLTREADWLDRLMAAVLQVGDRKTLEATSKVLHDLRPPAPAEDDAARRVVPLH